MKILVVAAHPDDETLGAGGTIARHVSMGDTVKVIILGTGISSRGVKEDKKEIEKLRIDSRKALSILGVSDLEFFDFPDNKFDSVPLLEIIKTIEKSLSEFEPEIIYTHSPNDLNIDHKKTFEAVLTAARPLPGGKIKKILVFEVPSSSEWSDPGNKFSPTFYVNINKYLEKKTNAFSCYSSEIRSAPHPRSVEGIKNLARHRGSEVGIECAEAFSLIRQIEG